MGEKRKKCARCGVEHPLSFFRRTKGGHDYVTTQRRKTICKECESKERIAKRDSNPFRPKARAAILYHAKKEGISSKQFSHATGLTLDYVESLFKDAWILHEAGRHCHSCDKPWRHDLDDFHLDRIFPDKPMTRFNVRVICKTCNVAKGKKDPTEYDLESLEYGRNKEAIKRGVQIDLPQVSVSGKSSRISENQLALFQLDSLGPDLS